MGRNFTQRQKLLLGIVQGVDPEGLEADHVVPWSKGGETDVVNGRLVAPEVNRAKGDCMIQLRKWQSDFLKHWDGNEEGRPYLLSVVPGGGKTIAALTAAKQWLDAGRSRQVFIVVPTAHLRHQWRRAACQTGIGIELQTAKLGLEIKPGYAGGVTTYQAACGPSHDFYRLCVSKRDTMLILDEPHHCGDSAEWGAAISAIGELEKVKEVLLLSGTPWRSDGTSIPFIKYGTDGMAEPSFRYGYSDALRDGVVRYLNFESDKGSADLLINDSTVTRRVASDVPVQEADSALRHMLRANGEFMQRFLRDGHTQLERLRQRPGNGNAGGMVACMDQDEARAVAGLLKRVTGATPEIAISDDPEAPETIKRFAESSSPWIVSVRQISEGTDIPRLQVLLYATNTLTEMFFQQLVGRVARIQGEYDREAVVMLPAHPTLLQFARNIDEQQQVALKDKKPKGEGDAPTATTVVCVSTAHHGDDVSIIGGEPYAPEEAARIHAAALAMGLTAEQFAVGLKAYMQVPSKPAITLVSKEEREENIKSDIKTKLGRLSRMRFPKCAKSRSELIKTLHAQWAKRIGKYQENLTEQQLEQKRDWVVSLIAAEKKRNAVAP